MGKIIDGLLEAQEDMGGFDSVDKALTDECGKLLQPFVRQLSQEEFEKMRDAVFTIAYHVKKAAFETGFRTAVELLLECREEKRSKNLNDF